MSSFDEIVQELEGMDVRLSGLKNKQASLEGRKAELAVQLERDRKLIKEKYPDLVLNNVSEDTIRAEITKLGALLDKADKLLDIDETTEMEGYDL